MTETTQQLHFVPRERYILSMDERNKPAAHVKSGDLVVVDCEDGYGGAIKTPDDDARSLVWEMVPEVKEDEPTLIFPVTGPIYVEGAEPGDVLKCRILAVDVADQGAATIFPEFGLLRDEFKEYWTKIAQVRDGWIKYNDSISLPVRPLIGTFGVAPAGEPISCLLSGAHGANMDAREVTAGSTVYLPVFVPGALLAMGDAKAIIGDGEMGAAGLEIAVKVTLELDVIKGKSIPGPIIETRDEIITCGSAPQMFEALAAAMRHMVDMLAEKLGIPRQEAYNLVSFVGHGRPGNVVTDNVSMRVAVEKMMFKDRVILP